MRTKLGARTARHYAAKFAWSVARGHYASEQRLVMPCCCGAELLVDCFVCSCESQQCATPGCHPVASNWAAEATGDPAGVAELWGGQKWWPIALTGIAFDAVVVKGPLSPSARARVESDEDPLGLMLAWSDDWHAFFVAPGAFGGCADLDRSGISVRGADSWIPLPAAALRSPARWISSPNENRGLVLNDTETVLSMLPCENQPREPRIAGVTR